MIAEDRMAGRLPSGQPLTATYLRSRFNSQGGDASFTQALTALIDGAGKRSTLERLDLRA
jgi:hypothetical protein